MYYQQKTWRIMAAPVKILIHPMVTRFINQAVMKKVTPTTGISKRIFKSSKKSKETTKRGSRCRDRRICKFWNT